LIEKNRNLIGFCKNYAYLRGWIWKIILLDAENGDENTEYFK
jgi:hypothetical protein